MRKILLFFSMSIFAATAAFAQKGDNEGAIVGGSNANISDYPYQVSIQTTSGYHFCGGTIIDDEWILTAAHCIDGTAASSIRVMAGASRISQSSSGQIRSVSAIYAYPGYSTPSAGKDAALLKLSSPLSFNSSVQAIPYATAADASAGYTNAGVMSTISGWGTLSSGGSSPDQLQAAQVPIVSNSYANAAYPQNITSDQLGAGYTTGGIDACQGDSGGPLVVSKGSGVIVAGIVSWGYGCADPNYPGMYGRVSSFATWIDGYVGGSSGGGGGGSTSYCASKGNNSSYEWIQRVDFANLWYSNSGDNGGYASYDASAWSVYQGTSYPITVDVNFSGSSYTEYYRVWIDYNGDGDFNDSGELILSKSSSSSSGVSGNFTVPSGAKSGNTRMRVSMKYNSAPGSCETFSYGEVEDYTINIGGVRAGIASSEVEGVRSGIDANANFFMAPNPAKTSSTLSYNVGPEAKDVKIKLYDVTGAVITTADYAQLSGLIEHTFDVQSLREGVYMISVESGDEKKVERLVVSK
ncbi:trypsin-like serine protease [Roseivirga sp. BDSF3-8]|uniref:trypsin-like serine protease n=1 Tax=Roseivirga sp. BDSF3-8 TaxID=3241598 RepID=UPI00353226BE